MFRIFPPHATDFYKTGHIRQYPSGTSMVYSNFTCRSDKLAQVLPDFDHKVVFFGLQGIVQWMFGDLWNREFFDRPRKEVVDKFQRRMDASLGVGSVSAEYIGKLHDLGYLPLLIKAIPEGERVDVRVPVLTIQNTHPDFYWLTNYVETQLSAELWKSITSATIAYEYKRLLTRYAKETGSPLAFVDWQGHDFSMRGMSGIHDATMSGAAHLTCFTGTDTISALDYLEDYYGAKGLIGGSVPATEHSVMCMGGDDCELNTFKRLLSTYPSGVVSIVSDTWDFWRVLTSFAPQLREDILKRNGKLVFRPDSGDPVKIICGDSKAEVNSPAYKGAVECLWDVFGGEYTTEGYRILDSHVGLIYGDSITLDRAQAILAKLKEKKFASCNVVFGIGSYTYQHVTRDTFGSAIKATAGIVNGDLKHLYKEPKTDDGTKKSAKGLIRVELEDLGGNERFVLHDEQSKAEEKQGWLDAVFQDGELLRHQDLGSIRKRLEIKC